MDNTEHKNYQYIAVEPISGALGAEIRGPNLSQPLEPEVVAEIRDALLNHLVIFIPNQEITPQNQLAFAQNFGSPMEYPQLKGLPECPLVTAVTKLEHERANFGGVWHSDTSYLEYPPAASLLYAVEIPPYGGDTLFANQQAAYTGMSDTMKRFAEGLSAVHSAARQYGRRGDSDRYAGQRSSMKVQVSDEAHAQLKHPVVRTHPETGAKALYVNRAFTETISGMHRHESKALLEMLWSHAVGEQFTCRVRWEPGTLTMWDNRSVQHYALNDYHGQRRHMLRVTIAGDRPR